MWKPILLWLCLTGHCLAGPTGPKRNMPIIQRQEEDMKKESTAVVSDNDDNNAKMPEAANSKDDTPPNMQIISTLTLPSNATSIRADITDGFSCANKSYGYYADIENDCQIFHVCMPVTYADGRENTFRWSFICPEETIFSQDSFTCMRREDMSIDCEESFKYYELNRNFGISEEEENNNNNNNKPMTSNEDQDQDQETAMTMTMQIENEKKTQQSQMLMDENVEKPIPMQTLIPTKEKPIRVQKPNRRKPSIVGIGNTSNKKKPSTQFRKEPPRVTQTATVQPAIHVTTMEAIPAIEENRPIRFTKRPPAPTMSVSFKEKLQPVKQSESTPVRLEFYNQKRKRPTLFNKKETITVRPAEEVATVTNNDPTFLHTTQSAMEVQSEHETSTKLDKTTELIASQASETNSVMIKPESLSPSSYSPSSPALPTSTSIDAKIIENKKISKPQPTEPEIVIQPEITKTEEEPMIVPLEAIEEIPALITEVEETNSNPEPGEEVKSSTGVQETNSEGVSVNTLATETNLNEPAIFQSNSEESLTKPDNPSIEEMEDKKPENAPETMPSTPDMEHQDPMIEQMLSEADGIKETMGGFKPVDPAMAAEAEALIANFLNTLMKSEKTKADSPMPMPMPNNELVKDETKISNEEGNLPEENASSTEIQPQILISDAQTPQSHSDSEHHTSLMGNMEPYPSMMMMMNNKPGEIFQIPVHVIQSPIEPEKVPETQTADGSSVPSSIDISSSPNSPKPISIDDIVELVKDKLDQVPNTETETETENENEKEKEKEKEKETQNNGPTSIDTNKNFEPADQQQEEEKEEQQEQTEQMILPIYHRVSAEPNSNMITAHESKKENESQTLETATSILESEMNASKMTKVTVPTKKEKRSNKNRIYGARNIKTATKIDPRKRRFLFKSDAS